jgi:hypothetical protein
VHRDKRVVASRFNRTVGYQPFRKQLPDQRYWVARECQLVADAHGEQSSDAKEKQAGKEVLDSNSFMVFRPNIFSKEAELVAPVVISSINGSLSNCLGHKRFQSVAGASLRRARF